MKITVESKEQPKDEIEFPCLMISDHENEDDRIILLVTDKMICHDEFLLGIAIKHHTFTIGQHDTWPAHMFKKFEGQITLENS